MSCFQQEHLNMLEFLVAACDQRFRRWPKLEKDYHKKARRDAVGRVLSHQISFESSTDKEHNLDNAVWAIGAAVSEHHDTAYIPANAALVSSQGVVAVILEDGATILSDLYWDRLQRLRQQIGLFVENALEDSKDTVSPTPSFHPDHVDGGIRYVDMDQERVFFSEKTPARSLVVPSPWGERFVKASIDQHELIKQVDDAWRRQLHQIPRHYLDRRRFPGRSDWLKADEYGAIMLVVNGAKTLLQPHYSTSACLEYACKSVTSMVIGAIRAINGEVADIRTTWPTVEDVAERRYLDNPMSFRVDEGKRLSYEQAAASMDHCQASGALLTVDWDGMTRLFYARRGNRHESQHYPNIRAEDETSAAMDLIGKFIEEIPENDLPEKERNVIHVERIHGITSQCGYPVLSLEEIHKVKAKIVESASRKINARTAESASRKVEAKIAESASPKQ
ncbi:hypothetical protein K490DRAFT_63890 [Saccharata proteae CBS 121410]|uniref:Uncharacterized protein n=1 Tax=Saccharata proteae CBS 121410 TaxID=1314787 RepID=A0A6A5YEJ3_9PEZI|nr:hypothetical protein K490DRAFT_63890 [Saccharata proteae CBS 121410]